MKTVMYPQQPNQPQGGYPPQTPPPTPGMQPPQDPMSQAPQPDRHYSPMPNYSPMSTPPLPPPQPLQPQQQLPSQAPAGWYTPPPQRTADADKPASVDSYLQQASTPGKTTPGMAPPGQKIHGQYAVDYLGGIAPGGNTGGVSIAGKQISKKMLLFIGGGVAALLLALVLLAVLTNKPKKSNTLTASSLYTSMVDTADVTKSANKIIKSSELRGINSSLGVLLTGSIKEMETPLTKTGSDPKQLNTAAKKPPYKDEKLRAKLEDARLLGTYDRVYANEMELRVNTMIIAMQSIKKRTASKSMAEFIDKSIPEYERTKKSIEAFQDSSTQ